VPAEPNAPVLPAAPPVPTVSFSGRYLVIVGVLLLAIIIMLAALWTRERSRRVVAENDRQVLLDQLDATKKSIGQIMMGSMGSMGPPAMELPSIRPFQRQDHAPVTVTLDGAKRSAYVLPVAGAARFGFQAGDVIVVMEGPASTSSPASAPANAPSGM
jgi:hypothetical protein